MPDLHKLHDSATIRDVLAALAIALLAAGIAFGAFIAIAYFVMVGIAGCPDPWQGCETVMGVVE